MCLPLTYLGGVPGARGGLKTLTVSGWLCHQKTCILLHNNNNNNNNDKNKNDSQTTLHCRTNKPKHFKSHTMYHVSIWVCLEWGSARFRERCLHHLDFFWWCLWIKAWKPREPCTSWDYKTSFGILVLGRLLTWPARLRFLWIRVLYKLDMPY